MHELTKKFKNELRDIIKLNGLNPDVFIWEVTGSDFNTVTVEDRYGPLTTRLELDSVNSLAIKIDDQPYFFTFDRQHTGKYCSSMRPALEKGDKIKTDSLPIFLNHFAEWLSIIKYELEEPDLWKFPFAKFIETSTVEFHDDAPFSVPDQEKLKGALDGIQRQLKDIADFGEQRHALIEERFDYLKRKLETSSKIDWKNMAVGILMHIFAEPWLASFAEQFKTIAMQKSGAIFWKTVGWLTQS
jgi:hypothetical protein